jgi:hypothetical protein
MVFPSSGRGRAAVHARLRARDRRPRRLPRRGVRHDDFLDARARDAIRSRATTRAFALRKRAPLARYG